MERFPKPRIVAGIGLALVALVALSSLRLSYLAAHESFNGIGDPYIQEIPSGAAGMTARLLVHLAHIGLAIAVLVGMLVRRPWGRTLAIWFLPLRFALIVALVVAGGVLGLNLFHRLEDKLVSTGFLILLVQLPLLLFSKELKGYYRLGESAASKDAGSTGSGAGTPPDEDDPYRRTSAS